MKLGKMKIVKDDLQLGMYESGGVSYPYEIKSGGMGPCIAIGIFDYKKRFGYMRHQPNAQSDHEIENFILEVLRQSNRKNLKIYICGGSIDDKDEKEITKSILESRDYINTIASKYFTVEQITINWSQNSVMSELILNTKTGEFLVEFSEY